MTNKKSKTNFKLSDIYLTPLSMVVDVVIKAGIKVSVLAQGRIYT